MGFWIAAWLLAAIAPDKPILVSQQALADRAFSGCLGESARSSQSFRETEPYAAVNPKDPKNIVAAWQVHGKEGGAIQVSASFDGGRSWSAPKSLPINHCAGGAVSNLKRASDPWVAFGPEGRAYVAAIGFLPSDDGPDLSNGIFVLPSPDGGRTWEAPGEAALSLTPFRWHDNAAVVADPIDAKTAYVLTTRYEYPALEKLKPGEAIPVRAEGAEELLRYGPATISKTIDGGRTWAGMKPITTLVAGGRVSAPQLVIDPSTRRLFAIYHRAEAGKASISLVVSTITEKAGAHRATSLLS